MKAFHALTLGIVLAIGSIGTLGAAEPALSELAVGSGTHGKITSAHSALYRVDLRKGQIVAFQVTGTLRARLSVSSNGQSLKEFYGYSFSGHCSRENPTLVVRAKRSGPHTVSVSGLDSGDVGAFTLSSKTVEAYDGGTLQMGACISDDIVLDPRSLLLWIPQGYQGPPHQFQTPGRYDGTPQRFQFSLPARRVVRIDMLSNEIDSKLTLRGDGIHMQDDNGGDGKNARIGLLLEAGNYDIKAGSASGGTGNFKLMVWATEPPSGTLTMGDTRHAILLPGMTDRYTVPVRSAGQYIITMHARDFDTHLRLLRGSEEIAFACAGDFAYINGRLEPGDYVVEASSVDVNSRAESYTIKITQGDGPGLSSPAVPQDAARGR